MDFGKNLKKIRNQRKISQEGLAKIIGVSRQAIVSYEAGRREPKFKVLLKIADYFNVSTDYLLGRNFKDNVQNTDILKANIKQIMKNMTVSEFVKEVGDKTGILLPIEKLEALISGNSNPDSLALKILAMYAGVNTEHFYKSNS